MVGENVNGSNAINSSSTANGSLAWVTRKNGAYYINLPDDNWSEYYPVETVWHKLRIIGTPISGSTEVTVNSQGLKVHSGGRGEEEGVMKAVT